MLRNYAKLLSLVSQRSTVCASFCSQAADPQKSDEIDYIAAKVDKNNLLKLRKSTGYSFVNCKKALVHHGDDLQKAEQWLHNLAREQGWEKAAKVGSRKTGEGLIGLATSGSVGAMVEVNCETDFVARNPEFHKLVSAATFSALALATSARKEMKLDLPGDMMGDMEIPDVKVEGIPGGQKMADFLTHTLGKLGENIKLARLLVLAYPNSGSHRWAKKGMRRFIDVQVVGYAHPRSDKPFPGGVMMGEFGTLVGIRRTENATEFPTVTLGQQICQQIIAMKPKKVGKLLNEEEENKVAEEKERSRAELIEKEEKLRKAGDDDESQKEREETDEVEKDTLVQMDQVELLKQDFILSPNASVGKHLVSHGADVVDFVRYNVGEEVDEDDSDGSESD